MDFCNQFCPAGSILQKKVGPMGKEPPESPTPNSGSTTMVEPMGSRDQSQAVIFSGAPPAIDDHMASRIEHFHGLKKLKILSPPETCVFAMQVL
jgi:hypothetical protein